MVLFIVNEYGKLLIISELCDLLNCSEVQK